MTAIRQWPTTFVLLAVCVFLGATGCTKVQSALTPKWLAPADEKVAVKLQRPVCVGLAGHRLDKVLDWTGDLAGKNVRFHVNWPALRNAGATPATPIEFRIERATLGQALHAVLQVASADYEQNPIDYRIVGGMVLISTRADLYRSVNVREVYNVRDIIVNLADYQDLPGYRPPDTDQTTLAASAAGSNASASMAKLVQIITDTIGTSEDWAAASIHEMDGDLVIATTPENQRQIKALLKDLRKSREKGRKVLRAQRGNRTIHR